jgi:hypothetical protein
MEHLFRVAASVDINKSDVERYYDFVDHKVFDLLLMGQAAASANGRDTVEAWDLPITKGLQESIHAFEQLDLEIGLEPILERKRPAAGGSRPALQRKDGDPFTGDCRWVERCTRARI